MTIFLLLDFYLNRIVYEQINFRRVRYLTQINIGKTYAFKLVSII